MADVTLCNATECEKRVYWFASDGKGFYFCYMLLLFNNFFSWLVFVLFWFFYILFCFVCLFCLFFVLFVFYFVCFCFVCLFCFVLFCFCLFLFVFVCLVILLVQINESVYANKSSDRMVMGALARQGKYQTTTMEQLMVGPLFDHMYSSIRYTCYNNLRREREREEGGGSAEIMSSTGIVYTCSLWGIQLQSYSMVCGTKFMVV
jgi:hypothetical protein